MERHGFIHDMLDVKLLILLAASHAEFPVDSETIYDLCYQDETLSYFDLKQALPQLVDSGHLAMDSRGLYTITDKGREHAAVMDDLIAVPVHKRVLDAVCAYNARRRRDELIHVDIAKQDDGEFAVSMQLDYDGGRLIRLELSAPTEKQARAFGAAFRANAEEVYQSVIMQMLGYIEKKPGGKN